MVMIQSTQQRSPTSAFDGRLRSFKPIAAIHPSMAAANEGLSHASRANGRTGLRIVKSVIEKYTPYGREKRIEGGGGGQTTTKHHYNTWLNLVSPGEAD